MVFMVIFIKNFFYLMTFGFYLITFKNFNWDFIFTSWVLFYFFF